MNIMSFNEFVNNLFSSPTRMIIIFGAIIVLSIILVLILLFAGKGKKNEEGSNIETPVTPEPMVSTDTQISQVNNEVPVPSEPTSTVEETNNVSPMTFTPPQIEEAKEEVPSNEIPMPIIDTMAEPEENHFEPEPATPSVSFEEPVVPEIPTEESTPVEEEKPTEEAVPDLSNTNRFSFGDLGEYEKNKEDKEDIVYMDDKKEETPSIPDNNVSSSPFPMPDPDIYKKSDDNN